MNALSKQVYRLYTGWMLVFRAPSPRLPLLRAFLGIEWKRMGYKLTGRNCTEARLWHYRVTFPDYLAYANLFREIFLLREYAFSCDHPPRILDCGSNVGMSVLFFKHHFPDARIDAFEPDAEAFGHLEANVSRNGLADVTLHRSAIYNREGEVDFCSAAEPDTSSRLEMSIFPSSLGEKEVKRDPVPCTCLSSQLDEPVDFLKLDVQGAEYAVLKEVSAKGRLDRIREMVIEYHYDPVQNPLGKILSLLEDAGFYVSVHAFHQPRLPPYPDYRGEPFFLMIYAARQENG